MLTEDYSASQFYILAIYNNEALKYIKLLLKGNRNYEEKQDVKFV